MQHSATIVSRTNFFRAAIPTNGIYDLVSFTYSDAPQGEISWAERTQPRLGGPLWAQRSRYIDNSPLHGADRIQTPLLILQGGDDWLRPQAESFYVALQRLDKPAQLAIYEGCGHRIAAWPLKQAVAGTERILRFLDKHLGPN